MIMNTSEDEHDDRDDSQINDEANEHKKLGLEIPEFTKPVLIKSSSMPQLSTDDDNSSVETPQQQPTSMRTEFLLQTSNLTSRQQTPHTFFNYLKYELNIKNDTDMYCDSEDTRTEEIRKGVYNFIRVPIELEKFITFGFFVCLDAYLFYFTFLPLRLLFGLIQLILRKSPLRYAHLIDMIRSVSLITTVLFVSWVADYSHLYHFIRGESALKLYMMYNMLEVFDRLCCSLGQDIQNSLYLTVSDFYRQSIDNSKRSSLWFHTAVGLILNTAYLCVHSYIQLYRVITLNVALNSSNNALWTLLVSNNFVEIKGSVFKRFGNDNLFQLACGDVVERLTLVVFGIIIYMQNARAAVYGGAELLSITITFIAEIGVDSTKHAFVTKYNDISSTMYSRFRERLCVILTNNRNPDSFLDNTSLVSRKIGFIEVPLIALTVAVFLQSMPSVLPLDSILSLLVYVVGYCTLFALKVLLSIIVVGFASRKVRSQQLSKED